jgi:hypothetical protein
VLAVLALGTMGLAWLLNGQSGNPRDARVEPYVLTAAELAAAAGGAPVGPDAFQRTNPPIDIGMAERAAQGAAFGRFSLPDARAVATYRHASSGDEITSVALIYDDPAEAVGLDAKLAPLLSSALGLASETITLEGTADARRWTAPRYQAISFRQGGVVSFVGTDKPEDPAHLLRLAEAARERVAARLAAATAEGPLGPTAGP